MARTKGARKKGRTKRIGTKRMRKTSMKKGDKGTKGKKGKKKTRKRKMKGGDRLERAGIFAKDTSRAGDLAELRQEWIKEGLTPISPPAGSYDVLKIEYDKQMKGRKRRRMKAAARAARAAAEEAAAEEAAAGSTSAAARRIMDKNNFLDFKTKLLDEILYKYEDEDYVRGDLSMLEDGPLKKVKALVEKFDFDMLRDEFGGNSSDLVLISDMEKLYNVEKDRLAAKTEQERLAAAKAEQEMLAAEKAEQERLYKVDMESKINNFLFRLHLDTNEYDTGDLKLRVDHYKKNKKINKRRADEAEAATELVELIENLQVELDQLNLPLGIINELKNLK